MPGRSRQAMLQTRLKCERHDWLRVREGTSDRWIAPHQDAPERIRIGQKLRRQARDTTRTECKAGARHTVVEAQAVHPPFIDEVVHCSPVIRIRTVGQAGNVGRHELHAGEMTE
jgi:hypothetical protein